MIELWCKCGSFQNWPRHLWGPYLPSGPWESSLFCQELLFVQHWLAFRQAARDNTWGTLCPSWSQEDPRGTCAGHVLCLSWLGAGQICWSVGMCWVLSSAVCLSKVHQQGFLQLQNPLTFRPQGAIVLQCLRPLPCKILSSLCWDLLCCQALSTKCLVEIFAKTQILVSSYLAWKSVKLFLYRPWWWYFIHIKSLKCVSCGARVVRPPSNKPLT